MSYLKKSLFLFSFLAIFVSGLVETGIAQDQLDGVDVTAQKVLDVNKGGLFLGLGRSPVAVMAYLECTLGEKRVFQIPLSNFRRANLSEAAEQFLFDHFQKFLPNWEDISDHGLVMVDYAVTGLSLGAFYHSFWKYYHYERAKYLNGGAPWLEKQFYDLDAEFQEKFDFEHSRYLTFVRKINRIDEKKVRMVFLHRTRDLILIDNGLEHSPYLKEVEEVTLVNLDTINTDFAYQLANSKFDRFGKYGYFDIRNFRSHSGLINESYFELKNKIAEKYSIETIPPQ